MPSNKFRNYSILAILTLGLWFALYIPFLSNWPVAILLVSLDLMATMTTVIVCNEILIPRFIYRRKFITFTALFVLLLLTVVAVDVSVVRFIIRKTDEFKQYGNDSPIPNLIWHFIFFLVGTVLWAAFRFIKERFQTQKKLEAMGHEKLKSEMAFLKSQINPHILFNSLNLIYGSVEKKNENARKMILQLSDMLRYQIYECNADVVEISKELDYLENFVSLQKLRKGQNVKVLLDIQDGLSGFKIAPLLFIPFVENAFKYVSAFENRDNFIDIRLGRDNGSFFFQCTNSKDMNPAKSPLNDGGIGIENVVKRLDLTYPNKHKLDIEESSQTYEVKLSVKIVESKNR